LQKETWGSYGQHNNLYTFVISLSKKTQTPIFEIKNLKLRRENRSSRKNTHMYTYISQSELKKLAGSVLKFIEDGASSSKRVVNVYYKRVSADGSLQDLEYESLRDEHGFYDQLNINGIIVKIRKDQVEVI
jgi:hypothetical protein